MHGIPKQTLNKILANGLNEHFAGGNKGSLFGEGFISERILKKWTSTLVKATAGTPAHTQQRRRVLDGSPAQRIVF